MYEDVRNVIKFTLSSFLVLRFIPAILIPQMSFISPRPTMPKHSKIPTMKNPQKNQQWASQDP